MAVALLKGRVLAHRQRVALGGLQAVCVGIAAALEAAMLERRRAVRGTHILHVLLIVLVVSDRGALATKAIAARVCRMVSVVLRSRIFILERIVQIWVCSLCVPEAI